jgi:hypothetical protein
MSYQIKNIPWTSTKIKKFGHKILGNFTWNSDHGNCALTTNLILYYVLIEALQPN